MLRSTSFTSSILPAPRYTRTGIRVKLFRHKSAPLLAVIALFSPPTLPQTRVTVAQFEEQFQVLAQQKEGAAASQLSHFQLTERVSNSRLAELQSQGKGQLAWQILLYLADESSINDLPAADLPSAPPPDETTSDAILEHARQYVRGMRPRLPNFSATRTTTSFRVASREQMRAEESQLQMQELTLTRLRFRKLGAVAGSQQLFLEDSYQSTVTYRGGFEVQIPPETDGKHRPLVPRAMTSAGEFGAILTLVDSDSANGFDWSHWEQGPSGLLAVYAFSVPADRSHFEVSGPMYNLPDISSRHYPAYHGEVAIDPGTGSVYRLAVVADPSPLSFDLRITIPAAIVVEYGPVEIGGKSYICPIHSIAINQVIDSDQQPPRTLVNDVSFTDYHLFRSDMRMLP